MTNQKNHITTIVIGFCCLWTIINQLSLQADVYSIVSFFVGSLSIAAYYSKNKYCYRLMYLWVFMQVPSICYSGSNIINSFPLSFGLGMGLTLKHNDKLDVYLNVLPIGLYYLIKYFEIEKSIGLKFKINRFRKGSFQNIQFPIEGEVEKLSGRMKFAGVYLIKLTSEVLISGKTYTYIMLETKDFNYIKDGVKRQICGLRICENPELEFNRKQNLFVDWVIVDAS